MSCTCSPCSMCHGKGSIWVDAFTGRPVDGCRDDMDDLETCEECNGSGIEVECDACRDQRERDEDEDEVSSK